MEPFKRAEEAFARINQRMEDLSMAVKAHDLLEKIYLELGPYTNLISSELSKKLNDFFDFDDSE